jgi:Plasmid stabilization system protein
MPPVQYEVLLFEKAEKDLVSIYEYVLQEDGFRQAEAVEKRLLEALVSLGELPNRGKHPPEMTKLGISDYRELQVSPWRIFYYVIHDAVGVVAILDGRRDVKELLQKRVL